MILLSGVPILPVQPKLSVLIV